MRVARLAHRFDQSRGRIIRFSLSVADPGDGPGPTRGLLHERRQGHRSRLSAKPEQDADGGLAFRIQTECATLYLVLDES
jgi:hypothetical protein